MGFFSPITNFHVKKIVYVCPDSLKYCRVKKGLNKHNPTKIEIGNPLVTNRKDYAVIVTSLLLILPNQPCNSLTTKECWQYCEFSNRSKRNLVSDRSKAPHWYIRILIAIGSYS